ncbi:hypothetical protein AAE478_003208 [Parahypoxylon ruwenzoriense]
MKVRDWQLWSACKTSLTPHNTSSDTINLSGSQHPSSPTRPENNEMASLGEVIYQPTKQRPSPKDSPSPICSTGAINSTNPKCITYPAKETVEINDDFMDLLNLAPSPLRSPSGNIPNSGTPTSSRSSSTVSSEILSPLPSESSGQLRALRPLSLFPSPYPLLTTSKSSSTETLLKNGANDFIHDTTDAVHHTQSHTDSRNFPQWKPLPKPPQGVRNAEPNGRGNGNPPVSRSKDIGVVTVADRNNTCRDASNGNYPSMVLPPATIRSKTPIQPTLEAKGKNPAEVKVKPDYQPDNKPIHTETEHRRHISSCKKLGSPIAESQIRIQKFTPEEMLWLHRNYRGEATFLHAWGLHITREVERQHGYKILRELMAAELPKLREQEERAESQDGKFVFITPTPTIPTPRDRDGLLAIEEEIAG